MKAKLQKLMTEKSDFFKSLAKAMLTAMGLAILFGWIAGDGNAWGSFDSISSVVLQMLKTKFGLALFATAGGCLAAELVKTAPFWEELK
ncbi:hypothetical protein [Marinobacter sp. DY40_1A1]|uniref:hypothetical protein n=1 Tax=Marinobacter sp. DY40_1A1 TaxID=2583229 RepID=UPI0019066E27|nr:hypothetical protein [Marinobacter sp. DY40_1A1]MBK1885652.1 hypothetical protein [Marinobacter sp. DY40_1A1]